MIPSMMMSRTIIFPLGPYQTCVPPPRRETTLSAAMPGDKGRDGSPARDKWQRAISKVAASTAIAEETAAGERFARIVYERTFVDRVNNERAFLAAFGQRSLHNQLSSKSLKVDSGWDLETELEDAGTADGARPPPPRMSTME